MPVLRPRPLWTGFLKNKLSSEQAYNKHLVTALQGTFLILILLILFLGFFAVHEIRSINAKIEALNYRHLTAVEVSASILARTYATGLKFREYLASATMLDDVIRNSEGILNFFLRVQRRVSATEEITQSTEEYETLLTEYIALLRGLETCGPKERQTSIERLLYLEYNMIEVANTLVHQTWDFTNSEMAKTERITQKTKNTIAVISFLAFVVGLIIEITILMFATWLMQKQSQLVDNLQRKAELEASLRKMEVSSLEAQVNPHFLFNTLNTITAIATLEGAASVPEVTGALSDLLRYSLGKGNKTVTLQDEIECAQKYLFIQKTRFGERLRYTFQIEPQLLSIPMPRMTLQPLIENAVKHGLEPKREGGIVRVESFSQGEWVVIKVTDD